MTWRKFLSVKKVVLVYFTSQSEECLNSNENISNAPPTVDRRRIT